MSTARVACEVCSGAQQVAASKAAVLAKGGGGAIHVVAGREGHAEGGGAGLLGGQVIGALTEVEAGGGRQELISSESRARRVQLEGAIRAGRGEKHGAYELSTGLVEPGRATKSTPKTTAEIGSRDAQRSGVQLKELAGRAGRAVCPEAGDGPSARPLAGVREIFQLVVGVESGVNWTARRWLGEADKAAPDGPRRIPPPCGPAETPWPWDERRRSAGGGGPRDSAQRRTRWGRRRWGALRSPERRQGLSSRPRVGNREDGPATHRQG